LVSWSVVRAPKDRGGLGIRDPALLNLAMGGKMVWRLIIGKVDWWKKVFGKNISIQEGKYA
jgi:hypothetical protein